MMKKWFPFGFSTTTVASILRIFFDEGFFALVKIEIEEVLH